MPHVPKKFVGTILTTTLSSYYTTPANSTVHQIWICNHQHLDSYVSLCIRPTTAVDWTTDVQKAATAVVWKQLVVGYETKIIEATLPLVTGDIIYAMAESAPVSLSMYGIQ